jgi:hypothetical protein
MGRNGRTGGGSRRRRTTCIGSSRHQGHRGGPWFGRHPYFFERKIIANLGEHRKWVLSLEEGRHVGDTTIEAMKRGEDQGAQPQQGHLGHQPTL